MMMRPGDIPGRIFYVVTEINHRNLSTELFWKLLRKKSLGEIFFKMLLRKKYIQLPGN